MKRRTLKPKKGDWLAVGLVCALAAGSLLALPALSSGGTYAEIYQGGELLRRVPLSVDQSFCIRGSYTNTVTIQDGQIAITDSDCPNHDCVRMGWLRDGGSIICLPNQVEIRLTGETTVDAVIP